MGLNFNNFWIASFLAMTRFLKGGTAQQQRVIRLVAKLPFTIESAIFAE